MARHELAQYRAKRDFKRSAEPSGYKPLQTADYPRFVVQKHDATRLHYDLRLEVDGVFKSWAVTKGPSLDPHDKRLAVEVEDHPLDYGDFEGTIPKGQYGGGTVMLWDRGFWQPEQPGDVAAALKKGELKFTLAGTKLKGSWVLVRMKHDGANGTHRNWLLIKHADEFEQVDDTESLLGQNRSVASGRTMTDIAAGRGRAPSPFMALGNKSAALETSRKAIKRSARPKMVLGAETPDTTADAVKTMPEFIAPQLCQLVERPPTGQSWGHEIKFDGYRMQLRIEAGDARMRTRNGLDWTNKFRAIADGAKAFPDSILDGEVVALDGSGAPDFAALQVALSEGRTSGLVFFAFDLLFLKGKDQRKLPLTERKRNLKQVLDEAHATPFIRYVEHLSDAGEAVLKSACRMHLEGIVSKRLDAPYVSARSSTWTKAKCRGGHEVVVGGWSGSKSTLRSLLVGVHDSGGLVYVGRVGTGFNARNTPLVLKKLIELEVEQCPFRGSDVPQRKADWHWVKPELVAEIEFAGWTGAGMVRQAAFKGLREDKRADEIHAEPSAAAAKQDGPSLMAPKSTVAPRSAHNDVNIVCGVTISKPEKVLWPAAVQQKAPAQKEVTKLDLARYLDSVGAWMLPHLKGRPCSIVRAPDGLDGEHFFQRHAMRGTSNLVTLTTVSGDRKPYLQLDRREAIVAMAQIAALEFHPWNCAPDRPELPGRLVFDLDPDPDVAFATTIKAARDLHERLGALGLAAFCKTTGGKGLHVVVPLHATPKSEIGWPEAKAFSQAVCTAMANDNPGSFTLNLAKRARRGRIFLDYLRNDRTATAVAPLSPRLRPGAPVSMPLEWREAVEGLDPMRFTLHTAATLLAKSKPWSDYDDAARPLADAIKALVKRHRN